MNKKKQLIIAIVIFVIAFWGTQSYIDSQLEQYKEKKYITVIRAKKSLNAGDTLTAAAIEQAKIPEQYVPKARIRWEEKDQYMQLPLATKVLAGDYILETAFSSIGVVGKTLSQQLENEEYRAITIPVDENSSLARSIVTGDRIDILFTFSLPSTREKITTLLLQNVSVISTGSYSAAAQELGDSGKSAKYNTLTLKLSAADAARLNYARQAGNISLMLRSAQDNKPIDLPIMTGVRDILSANDRNIVERILQDVKRGSVPDDKAEALMREQAKAVLEMQKKQVQTIGK